MRSASKRMVLAAATVLGFSAVAAGQKTSAPVASVSQGREVIAGMDVTIAPDGSVTSVVPTSTLPEPIRQMLIKRVSQWRYKVPMWQGKPAKVSSRLALRLLAVPTTSGGFVMRVVSTAGESGADAGQDLKAPKYPMAAMKRGVGGTFVYSQRIHEDGRITNIKRLYPADVSEKLLSAMDESAQEALRASRRRPIVINDQPVVCDAITPTTFTPPKAPFNPVSPVDVNPLRAGLEQPCPNFWLATKIENTLL